MTTALEYLAFALVLGGVWRIGERRISGQWTMLWAQVAWICVAIEREIWSLALQSIVLALLTMRAIRIWRREAGR